MSDFIERIAGYVKRYAPSYGIKVYSPIIAQAILESAMGTSYKAQFHNYFGLKYRNNRVNCNKGYFLDGGSEQDATTGIYTNLPDDTYWYAFESMEKGVEGYFQFINIPNYANLKGVTDPEQYLINIKADHYASSLKYIENVMNVIRKYNLTQYDPITERKDSKMKINVHAGHNPDGKVACGAVGLIKESTENRAVKDKVIAKLQSLGHTVYDCTVEDGKNQSDVLQKIVTKCNANAVDLDVSIHFNSGAADKTGNGQTTGTEVFIYSSTSGAKVYADNICKAIATLGFKNRGVKTNQSLYVLKNTKADALLVECCFVDDADDVKKYDPESMATAIVKGITGQTVAAKPTTQAASGKLFKVQCGAYSQKANAEAQVKKLKAAGFDAVIVES